MAQSYGPPSPWMLGINLSGAEYGNAATGRMFYDYIYPTVPELDHYASEGARIVRIPVLAERLQPVAGGDLDAGQMSWLDGIVARANADGMKVILDPHGYGYMRGVLIGSTPGSDADFDSFWSKLAGHYASNPGVVFGLMNEPHDQSATQWVASANKAIAAIRAAGAVTQEILVPGTAWETAATWTAYGNAAALAGGVVDPAHDYAIEVHQYLDADDSGTHPGVVSPTIGVDRLQDVTKWAEATGQKLFLGEFGVTSDQASVSAMSSMLGYMQAHADVWQGGTYWASGPWMSGYMFSAEDGSGNDTPQMAALRQYMSLPVPAGANGGNPMPTATAAKSAASFVDSIGIGTDVPDQATAQSVADRLQYLGIGHFRTDFADAADLLVAGSKGAKADEILPFYMRPVTTADIRDFVATRIDPAASVIEAVEGPNEVQFDTDSYNGMTGPAAVEGMQRDLYAITKADPALNGNGHSTAVYDFSVLQGTAPGTYGGMQDYSDYGNVHAYGGPGIPSQWVLPYEVTHNAIAGNKPIVLTETGATTVPGSEGVSEDVQARWDVDALLDASSLGVGRTYLYNLQDWSDEPGQAGNFSAHYGLYRADGTAKPAAAAVHDLTTLLSAGGPGPAGATLAYSLDGMREYSQSSLFSKAGGVFDIALWNEAYRWDATTRTEAALVPNTVTVSLGTTYAKVDIYDPLSGTAPVRSLANVSSVSVQLGKDPLFVEVTPMPPALPAMLLQAGDQRVAAGGKIAFTLPANLFSDPAGGTVTYTAQAEGNRPLPSWLRFDPASGSFSGTLPSGRTAQEVVVVAHAASGTAAAESFHLYSTPATPALAVQTGDLRVRAGAAFSVQVPRGAFADPAGGQVSYSASRTDGSALPSWARFDPSSQTLSGTAPTGTATDQAIMVTATTASGGQAAEAFHVYASALTLGTQAGDQRLAAGKAFSFQLPASSFAAGGAAVSMSSQLDTVKALPSWLRFDGAGGYSGTAPTAAGVTGVRVDAFDGLGGHVAEAFHLYVA